MKKRVYYFTDGYPYGTGEKPFVEPEIDSFIKQFDVVLISTAYDEVANDIQNISKLPKGVKLIRCGKKLYGARLLYCLQFFLSKFGRAELKRILHSHKAIAGRVVSSALMYSRAKILYRQFKKQGIFSNHEASVYYTFWFNAVTLACSFEKIRNNKIKIVSRIHGYDLYKERTRFYWQPFQVFKANLVDRIIFLAESACTYFNNTYTNVLNKAIINPLGCSPAKRVPEKEDSTFRIVSCSNVIPLKRVDLIAKALSKLSDLDIEWVHFGDGSELDRVTLFVRQKNLNAIFFGHKSNAFIKDYYSRNYCDAFITTSSTEGLPVSIMEALSYGMPIIATRVGGIPEQIQGNGILLSKDPSEDEVASAILEIYNLDPETICNMRQKSFDIWKSKYNSFNNSKKSAEIIRSILNSSEALGN